MVRELHPGAQDLVEGKGAEDDAFSAAFVRGLDHKVMTQRRQIQLRDDGLLDEGRQEDRVGCVDASLDQLKVHRGFVFRPFGDFRRVDPANRMLPRPAMNGLEARIILRAVEDGAE